LTPFDLKLTWLAWSRRRGVRRAGGRFLADGRSDSRINWSDCRTVHSSFRSGMMAPIRRTLATASATIPAIQNGQKVLLSIFDAAAVGKTMEKP
jgi:hypothetical protein